MVVACKSALIVCVTLKEICNDFQTNSVAQQFICCSSGCIQEVFFFVNLLLAWVVLRRETECFGVAAELRV